MKKFIAWYKEFNEKHRKFCEFARFVIVGCITTAIDMLIMGIILYAFEPSLYPKFYNVWIGKAGDPKTIATVIGTGVGFTISSVFSYLLSVKVVYNDEGNSKTAFGAILYFVLAAIGLFLNMGGMWLGYDVIGINEWIVKIAMTLIVMFYNFGSRKLLIFRKSKKNKYVDDNNENIVSNQQN